MVTVLEEIHQWSLGRPLWQRDALRRYLTNAKLSPADYAELALICKQEGGFVLAAGEKCTPIPLGEQHIGSPSGTSKAVSLSAIREVKNVNALGSVHPLRFQPTGFTVIYGDNGSGKSGYTRILKRVCRARSTEVAIHTNIFDATATGPPTAVIDYVVDGVSESFTWKAGEPAPTDLSQISIFDSSCSSVYVEQKTDVAYRPFGLDLFTKLVGGCEQVRSILSTELNALNAAQRDFSELQRETRVGDLMRSLLSKTAEATLDELASLSPIENSRLKELQVLIARIDAEEPGKRAQELSVRARRFESLAGHAASMDRLLGDDAITKLSRASELLKASLEAAELASRAAFEREPLPSVGAFTWTALWAAAKAYSEREAYPGAEFPVTSEGARCVLCHEPLTPDALERFARFAKFVGEEAQREVDDARSAFEFLRSNIEGIVLTRPDDEHILEELKAHDAECGTVAEDFFASMKLRLDTALAACASGDWSDRMESPAPSPYNALRKLVAKLEAEASELATAELPDEAQKLRREYAELVDRAKLAAVKQEVKAEMARQQLRKKLQACIKLTDTAAITLKNTEMTKATVSEELRSRFQAELHELQLFLTVSVEPKQGSKGVLYHQVHFDGAKTTGWGIDEVLSEGEHRCIGLAAFLAELATQPGASAVVLDDPVSSLDHLRREVVANRLVREAKVRPVVVMTHDLFFLLALQEECERQDLPFEGSHLNREYNGVGIPVEGFPWYGLPVKKRIRVLRQEAATLKSVQQKQTKEKFEKEAAYLWGRLRQAWECGVEEVLLAGSVKRFSRKVSTQSLKVLSDITNADIKSVDEGMTLCSTWMGGHDLASDVNALMPGPEVFNKALDDLDAWRTAIEKRRQ